LAKVAAVAKPLQAWVETGLVYFAVALLAPDLIIRDADQWLIFWDLF
jgi:hypothetical protein